MKIVVDGMGGDLAPKVVVEGVRLALEQHREITALILTGDETRLRQEMQACHLNDRRVEIVHAETVVEMHEPSTAAVRRKKDSSITIAADLVKQGAADALVSAGHTGAAVAATTVKWRTLSGVERPGIAAPLPAEHGTTHIVDAGATVEAKPRHLLQFALMGTVYARAVGGIPHPKVGLMSVGEEDEKGTDFTRETFGLLKAAPGLNFVGNVEGHDLFEGGIDIVVCDGFTGNIVLKTAEATAKAMQKWLRHELRANPFRLVGAVMAKSAFHAVKARGSYESYGGSPLLGVNGICIIAHGSSSAVAIKNAIRVASEAVRHQVNRYIEESLARAATAV